MKALCWKELRENYRWALLAAVGLGFAQWYALDQSEDRYTFGYNWNGKGLLLDSPAFLAVTTFGCAAVGLLLGLIQILPELRRDQWAALLHRPVSRGTVFRGKVAGGLLLYALATVPPFLYSVWRVATPGHFVAGIVDLCAGAAFYFAALAMTLPRGVWFGVRMFPLLAAVHVSYFVQEAALFRVAVEAAVMMSLLLFTAGWATLLHQDRLPPRPWIGKAACLGAVFYGVCGLGDLGRSIFDVIGPERHSRSVQFNLSDTGLPLRLTYADNVVTSVTDPAGHSPTDKRFQPDQVRSHIHYLNWFSRYIGDSHGWHQPDYHDGYRDFYRYATFNRAYVYPRPEQWFYLVQQRVWVVYSPTDKVPLERLDRRGFVPLASPPEPFDAQTQFDELDDQLVQYDPAGARLISLSRRRLTDLPLPGPGSIHGVGTAYTTLLDNRSVTIFGLTLADRLAVYDEHGTLVAALPYHQDASRWGQLSLGMIGDKERFYLQYEPSVFLPGEMRAGMPSYLETMSARGEVLQTYTLPPEPPYWQSRSWPDYMAKRLQGPAFFLGGMGYQKIGALLGSKRLAGQWQARWRHDRELTRQLGVFVSLLSLALAVGAWFWARRARFPVRRAAMWTLFVLAFGLAGLVAFRAAADWPQFVPCPRCRRSRPVNDAHCPNCGADWPAAPAEGLEIFDDGAAVFARV